MLFRLVWYDTKNENRYETGEGNVHEFVGDREAIWKLWFRLTDDLKYAQDHVLVFTLEGTVQHPEKGLLTGMPGYVL